VAAWLRYRYQATPGQSVVWTSTRAAVDSSNSRETGSVFSPAGCNALQDDGVTPMSGDASSEHTVAVSVQADREELQRRQQEIRSELQAENISRSEAQ